MLAGPFGEVVVTREPRVCSFAAEHTDPPEHSQSRHNELLMTLGLIGRKRASAHTRYNGGPTQTPHV